MIETGACARFLRGTFLSLVATCVLSGPARAQVSSELDPLNYAFSAYLGSGIYRQGDRDVWIIRIPASFRVKKLRAERFGMKIRLHATFGFYDFLPADLPVTGLPDRIGTVTLMGGAQFDLPLGKNWVLSPFADFGAATDNETDDSSWIFGTGINSRAEWPWKRRKIVLWNQILYALNIRNQESPNDDFFRFKSKIEVRQPVGKIRGLDTAVGPYFSNELYFGEVILQRPGEPGLDVAVEWEVGIVYGTMERLRFWIITLPRLGIGYRFGDTGRSAVIKFSFTY